MKKYKIDIVEQAHESLGKIIKHKLEYSDEISERKFID